MSSPLRRIGLARGDTLVNTQEIASTWNNLSSNRLTLIFTVVLIGLLIAQMAIGALVFRDSHNATYTSTFLSQATTQTVLSLVLATIFVVLLQTFTLVWTSAGQAPVAPFTWIILTTLVAVFLAAQSLPIHSNANNGGPITQTTKSTSVATFVLSIILLAMSFYIGYVQRIEITGGLARMPMALGFV